MRLNDYIKLKRISITRAAKELSIARTYLHGIISGKQTAGRKLAQKIKAWSGGAVGYEDLWK